jgi:RimJ/RimL family protein N-acetyltransferase
VRHDLRLDGFRFRLRPVRRDDAQCILDLRGDARLNRHIHATSPVLADQIAWIERYLHRDGDWYFMVEDREDGAAVGTIALYDHDPAAAAAEWGRWLLKPEAQAAIESAWLIYRAAFEVLGLARVYCRTLADNAQVVSFHDSSGARRARLLPGYAQIEGATRDAVEHGVERADWAGMASRLERLARRSARTGGVGAHA